MHTYSILSAVKGSEEIKGVGTIYGWFSQVKRNRKYNFFSWKVATTGSSGFLDNYYIKCHW